MLKITVVWAVICSVLLVIIYMPSRLSRRAVPYLGVLVLLLTIGAYGVSREFLVPWNASPESRSALLTGDEPRYLLTALSIARDNDLDVWNNHEQQHYKIFQDRPIGGIGGFDWFNQLSGGRLKGKKNRWGNAHYTVHRPGISVFLAPVFWSTHSNIRWWSYLFISSVLSLFSVLTYRAASNLSSKPAAVTVICIVFFLAPPVLFYANQIYPEAVTGVLLAGAALILQKNGKWLLLSPFLLAAALWFSDRAIPVVAILFVICMIRISSWPGRAVVILTLTFSSLLFAAYCWHRFGIPIPIHYGESTNFTFLNLPIRILQVLFDRRQGWVWLFPPVLLLPGILWRLRRRLRDNWYPILLVVAFVLSLLLVASFWDWRGGTNPRGRFYVIPQILMLVIVIEWSRYDSLGSKIGLIWLSVLGAMALTPVLWLIQHPNWWFRLYHPFFGLESLQPLYALLPDLPDGAPISEWFKLLIWSPLLIAPSVSYVFQVSKHR
jgi:hypothetical protein